MTLGPGEGIPVQANHANIYMALQVRGGHSPMPTSESPWIVSLVLRASSEFDLCPRLEIF